MIYGWMNSKWCEWYMDEWRVSGVNDIWNEEWMIYGWMNSKWCEWYMDEWRVSGVNDIWMNEE